VRCPIFVVVLSAALAACGGGGSTHSGDTCDAQTPCSDGQVCDLTNPDGPACIDASGDLDGDGIPNAMDKCQHMAGGKFDEDGDGIGDECDACPIAKPLADGDKNKDDDNDGVDSPCDPNPHTDGDKIVLFNGFNDGAIPTGWKASSASWQVMGGEAIVTPTDATTDELLTAPLALPTSHTTLFAAFRVDNVVAGATTVQAAVTGITKLPMGDSAAECGSARAGTSDSVAIHTDAGSASMPFIKGLFDPAGLYSVLEQLDGGMAKCALIAPAESQATAAPTSGNALNQAGMKVRGAKTRFEYLLVVQKP
jgi:hypothetical protein